MLYTRNLTKEMVCASHLFKLRYTARCLYAAASVVLRRVDPQHSSLSPGIVETGGERIGNTRNNPCVLRCTLTARTESEWHPRDSCVCAQKHAQPAMKKGGSVTCLPF